MVKGPRNGGEGRGRKGREAFGCPRRRERERAHDCPFREFYLECLVARGFRAGEPGFGGAAERGFVWFCARERLFRRSRAPRLRRDAAKREPGAANRAAVEIERRGGGHHGEGK